MIIKTLRLKLGLTQQELADKVGMSRSTIVMIETGRNGMTVNTAKKIAEVLEVDWKDLFENK